MRVYFSPLKVLGCYCQELENVLQEQGDELSAASEKVRLSQNLFISVQEAGQPQHRSFKKPSEKF